MQPLSDLLYRKPKEIRGLSMYECALILDASISLKSEVENGPLVLTLTDKNGLLITKDRSKAWHWMLNLIDKQLNGTTQMQDDIKQKIEDLKVDQALAQDSDQAVCG